VFLPARKISFQYDFRTDFESHCAATADLNGGAKISSSQRFWWQDI